MSTYQAQNGSRSLQNAFTLIELMVVIAIIAILTAIILPSMVTSKSKARDSKRISDVGQIQIALELYYDRCKQYPATVGTNPASGVPGNLGVSLAATSGATQGILMNNGCPSGITFGSYISKVMTPQSGASPVQTYYDYEVNDTTKPTDYVIHARLENTSASSADSIPAAQLPTWFKSIASAPFACNVVKEFCAVPK